MNTRSKTIQQCSTDDLVKIILEMKWSLAEFLIANKELALKQTLNFNS